MIIQWCRKWNQARYERVDDWLLRSGVCGGYGGVLLTNLTVALAHNHPFTGMVTEALQLIERHDPRRFRRVQREVKYIAMDYLLAAGQWRHRTRTCALNLKYCQSAPDSPDWEWEVAFIATVIVHEATHGAVQSHGCTYADNNRVRVESLCHREQTRFASRLKSAKFDLKAVVPPFDETRWHESWNRTRLQERNGRLTLFWRDLRSGFSKK